MKKKLSLPFIFILLLNSIIQAQLRFSTEPEVVLKNSNYFIDASLFEQKPAGQGVLLGFPRADLVNNFVFDMQVHTSSLVAQNFFDGVLVYNRGKGLTKSNQWINGPVSYGFYYFSNPNSKNLSEGRWKKVGSFDVTSELENLTNLIIDNNQVYSFKGSFTADGSSTLITLSDLPAATANAITSLYKVTIYNKDKKLFTNTVYSFDAANRQIITGAPNVSVVYEAGNYNYILEYLK